MTNSSVQFSSVAQSCPTLWDPMPGLPIHHQLPEFTQTHVPLTIQEFVCKHLNFIPQAAKQSMSSHCHHIVISALSALWYGSLYFH